MVKNRFFAFGCSFTKYFWPTWADIVGKEFEYYENWGAGGAGNHYIFNSLIECIQQNKINRNDTIIICWSNVAREDRYINNWVFSGNVFTSTVYPTEWVNKFITERGCLIRDLAYIKSADMILKNLGCNYKFISVCPISYYSLHDQNTVENKDVLKLYSDVLDTIKPSFFEVIFNFDWTSRLSNFSDKVTEAKNKELKKRYDECSGNDWPSFEEAIDRFSQEKDQNKIFKEIKKYFPFDFFEVKRDYHPTPLEHLEYLQIVLPEISISSDTIEYIKNYKFNDVFIKHLPKKRL